jgi:hypothetical protein
MSDTISAMVDPVTRAARRQNATDRVAELLTSWGCPDDSAAPRAALIIDTIEQQGWRPAGEAPPLVGRGSTDEGRARARRVAANTRNGCTCGALDDVALTPDLHPDGCPVRPASNAARTGLAAPLP